MTNLVCVAQLAEPDTSNVAGAGSTPVAHSLSLACPCVAGRGLRPRTGSGVIDSDSRRTLAFALERDPASSTATPVAHSLSLACPCFAGRGHFSIVRIAQQARARLSQGRGHGFDSRYVLSHKDNLVRVAQLVSERDYANVEAAGSNPATYFRAAIPKGEYLVGTQAMPVRVRRGPSRGCSSVGMSATLAVSRSRVRSPPSPNLRKSP